MKISVSTIVNNQTIPAILAACESFAGVYFKNPENAKKLCLAAEEALGNITLYTKNESTAVDIELSAERGKFSVAITDKALPGDLETELTGDKGLGLELLHSIVDGYRVENLGLDGRRQVFSKYYEEMSGAGEKDVLEEEVPADLKFFISEPTLEYAKSLSKLYYNSFKFSYSWDIVYFPESYVEAYNKGEIHSVLAVDENGVTRGHLALCENEAIKGCYEFGMALSDPRCRNRGIMNMMTAAVSEWLDEHPEIPMMYADCTIVHPYSQKPVLKMGDVKATGFQLQTMPPEMYVTSLKTTDDYDSGALLCKVFDKGERDVVIPAEIDHIARHIYEDFGLPRNISNEDFSAAEASADASGVYSAKDGSLPQHGSMESVYLPRNNAGIITVHEYGEDLEKALGSTLFELKKNEVRLITVYMPAKPGAVRLYEYAKTEGFFFTGMFPATDEGDILIMQKLASSVVNYDYFQIIDEVKWIFDEVRKLDPDQGMK